MSEAPEHVLDVIPVRPGGIETLRVWVQPRDGVDVAAEAPCCLALPTPDVEATLGLFRDVLQQTRVGVEVRVPAVIGMPHCRARVVMARSLDLGESTSVVRKSDTLQRCHAPS